MVCKSFSKMKIRNVLINYRNVNGLKPMISKKTYNTIKCNPDASKALENISI